MWRDNEGKFGVCVCGGVGNSVRGERLSQEKQLVMFYGRSPRVKRAK